MGQEIGRKNGTKMLYVGAIPGRKREVVGVQQGSVLHVCAYFVSPDERERFLAALREIFGPFREGD